MVRRHSAKGTGPSHGEHSLRLAGRGGLHVDVLSLLVPQADLGDISIEALMGTLADTTEFNELKKRMERLSKGAKALDTPAARILEERATRKV